ncbi:hypothetical protein CYMTET_17881 [Cymbomonas tetramitiformis]|uniref:Uncharacterized protein n=1 Tax=Cymbomonas tetramitiformis TaxID=36881 RepID=A0AAE0G9C6_9CHLO|nr:hypothetical protein CYMTET_17881 [Cymbomonas tetramitiformis]
MGSGQCSFEQYEGSEEEDESDNPLGYYDSDSCEEEVHGYPGHLAMPYYSDSQLEQDAAVGAGSHSVSYGGVFDPSLEEEFLPQQEFSVGRAAFDEPDPAEFENEKFPVSENEEYTPEEWAAWESGAYDSLEHGGAQEEFVEHYDECDGEEYSSDDY